MEYFHKFVIGFLLLLLLSCAVEDNKELVGGTLLAVVPATAKIEKLDMIMSTSVDTKYKLNITVKNIGQTEFKLKEHSFLQSVMVLNFVDICSNEMLHPIDPITLSMRGSTGYAIIPSGLTYTNSIDLNKWYPGLESFLVGKSVRLDLSIPIQRDSLREVVHFSLQLSEAAKCG